MTASTPGNDPLFFAFQGTLAGRYSIDRELGRGGMGIVYLAREVHLDRLVAIKLLPPEKAAQRSLRERFLREVRLAAKLSHPNIIPIHAVEDAGGFVFYVMAFIDGETLAHRVRNRGPLPASDGARMLREVAWALSYAHGQGFVHRDVKPDNILIESTTNRVLVADFGIAAALGEVSGDGVSGTPEFMSPEQVLGRPIDARSDIYGLGVTAFFAFSGRLPFEGASATEILAKQVTEPAPPLASLGLPVPRRLAAIVDRCLFKEPERRPASAEALAEQLGVALEQRRELPAALRAFVKRGARLNSGGTIIVLLLILPVASVVSAFGGSRYGFAAIVAGSISSLCLFFVTAARKLMMLGFGHQDLAPAFKAEADQNFEELYFDQPKETAFGRVLPKIFAISGTVFLTLLGVSMTFGRGDSELFLPTFMSGIVTVLTGIGSLALLQGHRDLDTEFWARIWLGRIGRSAFAIASKLLGKRVPQSAMTHRATELSLGMAAEQLYESLPKKSRQALPGVPELLTRLQADAQVLRKRYDELQEVVSTSAPDDAELRLMRDSVHAKLGDAVGALETIRLNLLRLHAGSATVESLTTHLGMAREVSEEVERLIAAHADVERVIHFPRLTAPTPV